MQQLLLLLLLLHQEKVVDDVDNVDNDEEEEEEEEGNEKGTQKGIFTSLIKYNEWDVYRQSTVTTTRRKLASTTRE